jgi:hypothetical protein
MPLYQLKMIYNSTVLFDYDFSLIGSLPYVWHSTISQPYLSETQFLAKACHIVMDDSFTTESVVSLLMPMHTKLLAEL